MSVEKNIFSMTGFGRASTSVGAVTISIECKSLNSRYLEVSCKLPRIYNLLELELRQFIQSRISRGRVEVLVSRRLDLISKEEVDGKQTADLSELNKKLSAIEIQYKALGVELDNPQRFELASQLLNSNSSVSEEELLTDDEISGLKKTLEIALLQLQNQRKEEGRRLLQDLLGRLQLLSQDIASLKSMAANVPQTIKERVSDRIKASLAAVIEVDPARLLQEVTLLVEKADVTEELVRLESHNKLFEETLMQGGLVGKRLDFICQEIFRELNTLGGKSASAEIQAVVVNCKVELERIREQVQNLE